MIIDERKVNLAEKDIEQWLWENPRSIRLSCGYVVDRWIYRQFSVPSGIVDLVGVASDGKFIVVEVKNTEIGPDALTQVCRYAYDIDEIIAIAMEGKDLDSAMYLRSCLRVVIGRSIDTKAFREAEALRVSIVTFSVNLSLSVSWELGWQPGFTEDRDRQYMDISNADDNKFHDIMRDIANAQRSVESSTAPDSPDTFLSLCFAQEGLPEE